MQVPAWWNSINSVQKLNLWAQWLGASLTILAAMFGILILASGSRLNELQTKQAQAKEAQFKQRLETTEKKQQDRELYPEQRAQFLQLLINSPKGAVDIWSAAGDRESYNFALEINEVLKAAGWEPEIENRHLFSPPIVGLKMWVRPNGQAPIHATALLNILDKIGLAPVAEHNPILDKNQVVLVVGLKP